MDRSITLRTGRAIRFEEGKDTWSLYAAHIDAPHTPDDDKETKNYEHADVEDCVAAPTKKPRTKLLTPRR
ncbi:hypothetical protein PoMZ_07748 [Pyricularia oryzae]|uniref:Uncharacterized protein n=1 Tax=Pyricularia oryzae TaxID=318829 RepID=A0A4P7NFX0_PYROR|nr:hypothetical protein PoMZ_07748 [Pyricularia oryzae]